MANKEARVEESESVKAYRNATVVGKAIMEDVKTMSKEEAQDLLKNIEDLGNAAHKIEDTEMANAIATACDEVKKITSSNRFWALRKEAMIRFWTRVQDGFTGLFRWVTNTIKYTVDGVISAVKFVVDLLCRVIDGVGRLMTGTFTVVFGEEKRRVAIPAAAAA